MGVCVCVCVCVCSVTQQSDPQQVQLNSPSPYLHYNQIFVALQFHTLIIYSRWLQVNYFKCLTGTLNNWDVGIFSFPVLICQMDVCAVKPKRLTCFWLQALCSWTKHCVCPVFCFTVLTIAGHECSLSLWRERPESLHNISNRRLLPNG